MSEPTNDFNIIKNFLEFFIITVLPIVLSTLFLQYIIKKKWREFFNKTTLIKKYWRFVISFIIIGSVLGGAIYFYTENITDNLILLVQTLTLIFAIFVGYFAFQQVAENRLDKLEEKGYVHLKKREYLRATKSYEEAFSIAPKDFSVLSNLIECYLIIQDDKNFNEKKELIKKIIIEDREKLVFCYLESANFLLKQDLGKAKGEIKECIKFIKSSGLSFHSSWDFRDIKNSELYKNLNGEAKKIFDSFINYLQGILSEDQKKEFESGNYALDKPENKVS